MVWPTREEILNSTIVVLIAVAVISVFLFITDNIFEWRFDSLIQLGTGGRES